MEICERQAMSKILSKHVAVFDYFDKTSIVLSAASDGICITSFSTFIGASVGIASASFSFVFSMTAEIVKKPLKTT